MITLYDLEPSGNCHKVRLLLGFLGIDYQRKTVDFAGGEHKGQAFLKLNPMGEIPVLVDETPGPAGQYVVLRDSQAILVYIARKYGGDKWLPSDPHGNALVMQWLSTSANEIANGASAARAHDKFGYKLDVAAARELTKRTLQIFDEHLGARDWLELGRPTIADIACFPYLGLAHEGGVALEPYKNVQRWFGRIKALPGYVSMPAL